MIVNELLPAFQKEHKISKNPDYCTGGSGSGAIAVARSMAARAAGDDAVAVVGRAGVDGRERDDGTGLTGTCGADSGFCCNEIS